MKRRVLTEGPIGRQLLGLVAPMGFGIFAVMAFNLVDTWFVSLLGTEPLAAMSLTFPVVMVVGSLAMGLGVGATSVISRAIGGDGREEVRRLTTHALVLAALVVVVVSVAGLAAIDPIFASMGADEALLELAREYMTVWFAGAACVVVPMLGMSAIRATGDTRTPALVMTVAAVVNGVLDPIFIFGWGPVPAMGLRGAAVATVLARAITLVVALWVLAVREDLIGWRLYTRDFMDSCRRILRIGGPAAGTNLALPLTVGFLTGLAASYGPEAVAAFGAGGRIEMFALIPVVATGVGLAPFVGQNHGAGRDDRIAAALRLSFVATLGLGATSWLVLALLRAPLAGLFSDDAAVLPLLEQYLLVLPAAHLTAGGFFVSTHVLNALGRPLPATALTLLRAPVMLAGGGWLGAQIAGLDGFFVGVAVGTLLTGLVGGLVVLPLWAGRKKGVSGRKKGVRPLGVRS